MRNVDRLRIALVPANYPFVGVAVAGRSMELLLTVGKSEEIRKIQVTVR